MSRYAIDKIMREVAHDEAAQAAFLADAPGFLDGRDLTEEGAGGVPGRRLRRPVSPGCAPVPAVGVHPGRLPDGGPPPNEYVATITPHGTPDFAT